MIEIECNYLQRKKNLLYIKNPQKNVAVIASKKDYNYHVRQS